MKRSELVKYLDEFLQINEFKDYGPQGLQVEGTEEVNKISLAVDASLPAITAAVDSDSQFMLVHHGIFWSKVQRLVGPLGSRVSTLIRNDVSLYAVHLALDAHPEVGNNAVLANKLGIEIKGQFAEVKDKQIGYFGAPKEETTLDQLVSTLEGILNVKVNVAAYGPLKPELVGIVSGGASGEVDKAAELGIDTFITGERSHGHHWDALEHGINILHGGHYATETIGVKALGEHLRDRFDLEVEFLSFPTGL